MPPRRDRRRTLLPKRSRRWRRLSPKSEVRASSADWWRESLPSMDCCQAATRPSSLRELVSRCGVLSAGERPRTDGGLSPRPSMADVGGLWVTPRSAAREAQQRRPPDRSHARPRARPTRLAAAAGEFGGGARPAAPRDSCGAGLAVGGWGTCARPATCRGEPETASRRGVVRSPAKARCVGRPAVGLCVSVFRSLSLRMCGVA